jgi:hypothetical protein
MKEIPLVLLGLIVLFIVLVILMSLNEPTIFVDKKAEQLLR